MSLNDNQKCRVAVVGGGISGLSSAWYLSQNEDFVRAYEVHLYESQGKPGLGSHAIKLGDLSDSTVDVPHRLMVKSYYQELSALYERAGIETAVTMVDSGFYQMNSDSYINLWYWVIGIWFIPLVSTNLSNGIELLVAGFNYVWFCTFGQYDFGKEEYKYMNLGEYLSAKGYPESFKRRILLPVFSTVCTCSHSELLKFPWEDICRFATAYSSFTPLKRVYGGNDDAAELLIKNVKHVHMDCKVQNIVKQPSEKLLLTDDSGNEELFDHVIVATQASQAAYITRHCGSSEMSECLNRFKFVKANVIVHKDERFLPVEKTRWHTFQLHTSYTKGETMCTVWQNVVQEGLEKSENVFQTWNPLFPVKSDKVVGKALFERSIVDVGTISAIEDLWKSQGDNNVWICGAYCERGIPLLENGCKSGLKVAERISNTKRPWASAY
eukprot:Nk52_evm77s215 gene=Nk52_evmTU77s215